MANNTADIHLTGGSETDSAERVPLSRRQLILDARFRRCYRTLHLIAYRVLGGSERAEEAIENCWRIASLHPRWFECEGEFHSWLFRVLIDEALAFLRHNAQARTPVMYKPFPAQVFRDGDLSDSNGDIGAGGRVRFSPDLFVALD